ncbi:major facilitator superfamily domain-containing protein [Xylariaceae sp. FL0255]|nr:major facilitator superfamily domain-containing protein [Xylariaceae sp. FL0255]
MATTEENMAQKGQEFYGKEPGALEESKGAIQVGPDSIHSGEDILGTQALDPALNAKMHLVNNAIDEIGWTNYHWKLFVLNGFGYAVDSLITLVQANIAASAFKEFGSHGYSNGLTIASYAGLLVGALFWGFGADIIGRRWAFNISLFICSGAAIVAGAVPNWPTLGFFVALVGFGGGGNLILDTAVFLEYLPGNRQWMVTLMACWWGFGQTITGLFCYAFLVPAKWNCQDANNCTRANNMGWRYVYFTSGAFVLFLSILRITVVRLKETPKYSLAAGNDAAVVENLQGLAKKYNRPCSLTLEQLEACGKIQGTHGESRFSFTELKIHLSGLFATKKVGLSTSLIWASWTLIGLAYPLFYVFLPTITSTRIKTPTNPNITWRNYTITNLAGIPGPIVAGFLCNIRVLGRRYTMVIGALFTLVFFFAYTTVQTEAQNLAISVTIAFGINIYYGTLYAYTPEVLPSAHRTTGNGVAVACNRILGIISAVIATAANTATVVPLYITAALYAVMAIVAISFPFEPYGRRSS